MRRFIALLIAATLVSALTYLVVDSLTAQVNAATGGGVFSLHCEFSHTNNDDPIVFPDQPGAAHVHGFVGSRTTNASSTFDSMQASGTSCPVAKDTAGYWFPILLSPSGQVLAPVQVNIYYRSPPGVGVESFPADLRIIAGGDTLNPPQPSIVQRSLSWSCVDSGPFFAGPVDCGSRALIAHVHFPNCVLAGATDSPDHRTHMTYASGKDCPAGYVQVPKVSFHIRYKVPGTNDTQWRLTSDAAGSENGRSLHADFWNTWDQPTLACLVDTVLNGGLSAKALTNAKVTALGC